MSQDVKFGEWQPIESAPRTSNSILVYCPDRSNTYLVTWDKRDETWTIFGGANTLTEEPSHWMPRPQSPCI